MFKYNINIPLSRFRRELNAWMRFIEINPEKTIYLTRNNKVVTAVISPIAYDKLTS